MRSLDDNTVLIALLEYTEHHLLLNNKRCYLLLFVLTAASTPLVEGGLFSVIKFMRAIQFEARSPPFCLPSLVAPLASMVALVRYLSAASSSPWALERGATSVRSIFVAFDSLRLVGFMVLVGCNCADSKSTIPMIVLIVHHEAGGGGGSQWTLWQQLTQPCFLKQNYDSFLYIYIHRAKQAGQVRFCT